MERAARMSLPDVRFEDDYFDPGNIMSFNGRDCDGISLDNSTRDDLKKLFRTRGGDFIRAEATILTPGSGAPWQIQALQDGANGKARITGFHIEYKDAGPPLDSLQGGVEPPEAWYPPVRYSDWYVAALPQKGIALFVIREQNNRVAAALLTTPDRLQRMVERMVKDAPRIENLQQAFDQKSRDVAIGNVSVSFTKKDLKPRGGSNFEEDMRYRAQRDIDRRSVRYISGANGSVSINVSISFSDGNSNNSVEVSVQLNGSNERGQVSAFGSASRDIDKYKDHAYEDLDSALDRAYNEAMSVMFDQADRNIRSQRPPSPADYRRLAWLHLLNGPTK